MTSYTWQGFSGDWSNANDWTPSGGPPTSSDSATINGTATDTITVNTTTADVANSLTFSDANAILDDFSLGSSLTLNTLTMSNGTINVFDDGVLTVSTLNLSGGALTVDSGPNGQINLNGTLTQTGGTLTIDGTISGGTIDSTAGTIVWGDGILSGVTFDGPLNLTSSSASVQLANGTTVVGSSGTGLGTINDTGANAQLGFDNTQTVSNVKINLGNSSNNADLYEDDLSSTGNQVLTLASSATIDVQGFASILDLGNSTDGIVNDGTINVTGSDGYLNI